MLLLLVQMKIVSKIFRQFPLVLCSCTIIIQVDLRRIRFNKVIISGLGLT